MSGDAEKQALQRELAALQATTDVLKRRVEALQNRRTDAFAVFESMAHLEALVAERTEELHQAKTAVEQQVERRTRELKRKAEELTRANRMLQEMDRMKTHLLQNVSHELKTPLVSIRGYAELLRFRYAENLDTSQIDFLDIVIRNADHLNRVIEDLVQASQQARGLSPFAMHRFDLSSVVDEVLQELSPMAQKVDVPIDVSMPEGAVTLNGDERQIRQMVLNVVSNAIKFTAGCPMRHVDLVVRPTQNDVVLEVVDSGVGIPKERIHRIFERFYQVDPTATRKYGGMGIGLSLVHEVVENHQGTVFVESEPDKGTRFLIRLPLSQEEALVSTAQEASGDVVDIFVVEDQEESALFYRTALEEFGYNIASFTNPQEALEQVDGQDPRIILLDLSMPEMSGLDFMRVLAERRRAAERPMPRIVLITARSPDELSSMDLGGDVESVLYKPFSLDTLRTVLFELLPVRS